MLQTINTIQNPESYKAFIEKYFEDTLEDTLQALANSGNRIGVAGSSVKYNSYNIFDIIDDLTVESEDKIYYAIEFEYTGNQYKYQVYDTRNNKAINAEVKYVSESNTIDLNDESLYSTIKNKILVFLGHIDDISKKSIIHKKDNILTCIFKCHIINTEINSAGSAEYLYFQYDISTNTLINFIDTKRYSDKYHILYKLQFVEEIDKTKKYSFDTHLFKLSGKTNGLDDTDTLEYFIKQFIENDNIELNLDNLYIFEDNDEEDSFSFLNPQFTSFEALCDVNYVYNCSSIIQFILNHNSITDPDYEIYHFTDYDVSYHDNESMHFDDDSLLKKQILNKINKEDISEYLWMASSINELYKYLLDIYNSNYYISSKKQLFLNIIKSLYSNIYLTYNNGSLETKLYIPYNVKLNYLSSDINELKIMYINNIDIIHWNGSDIELSNDHITYYDSSIENKITNYNIYINYNNVYTDVINNIIVYKTYTYPYINKLNSWIINDVDSNISSFNELLSLNKTIILYCKSFDGNGVDDPSTVISRMNNIQDQDKKYFEEYEYREFIVNSNYFPSYKSETIKCKTYVPKITSINKNYFENVILLVITSKINLIENENTDYSTNYDCDYIFSLWKYTVVEDTAKFEPIIDPESENNINGKQYVFDPFGYKLATSALANNIIYAQANNNKTAQNINNITGYDYIVIRNKVGDNYNSKYSNNLNIIIECINNLNKFGSNPNYPTEKYITDMSSVITSNVLYPLYQYIETNQYPIIKYRQETETITELLNDETIQLYTYDKEGKTWLVSQQYIKEIAKTVEVVKYNPYIENTVNIQVGISNSERYNEFIPDKQDVPTIDYKEVLNRNVNVLNRINILGLEPNNSQFTNNVENRWYNGFFGTYFDYNTSKSVLGISTNTTNINVGTDTLFDLEQVKRFNAFDTFRIDNFKTIEFNPTGSIIASKPIVNKNNISNDYNIQSVSYIPIGYIYNNEEDSICINLNYVNGVYSVNNINTLIEFANYNDFDPVFGSELESNYLFIQCGTYYYSINQTSNTHLKSFKCLYLNGIIADKFGLSKTIIDNLNPSSINCGNHTLLCISTKNNSIGNNNVNYNYTFKNYFFMILGDQDELDNLTENIFVYNHQLNMTMCAENNDYKFNIKFDDKNLNKYENSILIPSNPNISYNGSNHTIEFIIDEYTKIYSET